MVLGCSVGWFWGSPWAVLWCCGTVPMSSGTTEAGWKMLPQREQLWAGGTPRKRTRCSPTWGDLMDLSPGHEDFPARFDVLQNGASGEGRLGCPGTAPCSVYLNTSRWAQGVPTACSEGRSSGFPPLSSPRVRLGGTFALLLGICEPSTLRLFPGIPSTLLFTQRDKIK